MQTPPRLQKAPPPPKLPISVTLIAKDCAAELDRCLTSVRANFLREGDELIVLDTSGNDGGATTVAARKHGARVLDGRDLRGNYRPHVAAWLPEFLPYFETTGLVDGALLDFGAARARVMAAARYDWQFWIDSDDVLSEQEPGNLRAAVEEVLGGGHADSIFLDYHYGHDAEDGSVCSVLKRERVIDRRRYHWVGRCHETAIPRPDAKTLLMKGAHLDSSKAVITHAKPPTGRALNASDLRNYVILRRELEETKEAGRPVDPRTEFYLANAARGLANGAQAVGRDREAIDRYTAFIEKSGSRDDRYAAAYFIATLYVSPRLTRPLEALDWFWRCVTLKPEDPRSYFGLSRAYLLLGRWQECLHWHNVGRTLPEPVNGLHNYDPRHIRVLPLQVAAAAAKELGDQQMASSAVDELLKVAPNHPETKQVADVVGNWLAGKRLVDGVRTLVANARPMDQTAMQRVGRAVCAHLPDMPHELEDMGLLPCEPPDPRPRGDGPDVAIYCGKAIEPWGPRSGEGGIGGSEKAVVQMAPRLQARGLRVTVYANVPRPQRGVGPGGVIWRHFGEFDRDRDRDVLIHWRAPAALELPFPAKRRIVWCHDVQDPARWTPARVVLADEVWVLSEAHARTLGSARAALGEKVWITRNGIDVALFRKYLAATKRDPKKVVYTSSPDRGLLTAIRAFKAADVPGSSLHIFYGFQKLWMENAAKVEYGNVADVGRDISFYDYMKEIYREADADPRIHWRGRVGWDELARELCSAGVWLYPTRFYEISCMSAMEAQAAGCIPRATDCAALRETLSDFYEAGELARDSADIAATLPAVMTIAADTPLRREISERALVRFDYEALASEWAARLKK